MAAVETEKRSLKDYKGHLTRSVVNGEVLPLR